jgi:ATP-binding cassette subfamily F protein 3
MALIQVDNVTHAHADLRVLQSVSLALDRGQRAGMVGRNGCGKTTLLRLIAGQYPPDSGQISLARGSRAGYLEQNPQLDGSRTLRREAEQAFADLADLHDQLDSVSHEMAWATGEQLDRVMRRYERIEHQIQAAGGFAVDHKIDATLHGLGLDDATFDVPVSGLSGGQKARLALAKLLLSQPDVLLLDEPTNHLDIEGRRWLEEFLSQYAGAVLLVSHDRWLLDAVVDRIVELEQGQLIEYPGNYAAFREQRELRKLEQQRTFTRQQAYVRHQKQFIQRYKTGQRAKEARGRQSRLDRFVDQEMVDPAHETSVMNLQLPPAARSGDVVLAAEHLGKRYDQRVLFDDVTLSIKRGQRIGVIGPNGCGKSTFVRCLLGQVSPDTGRVRTGSRVSPGYYHQTQEQLDPNDTPVTYLKRIVADTSEQSARDVAGAFLFSGTDQDKPVSVLSGGERSRMVLAGLVMGGHNLLVLDEPSNHLDIPSVERLEGALKQFDGTLLLVTHDRMLLEDTVDELLVFDGPTVGHFYGRYSEYLADQKARARAAQQAERQAADQRALAEKRKAEQAAKSQSKKAGRSAKGKPNKAPSRFGGLNDQQLEQRIMDLESQISGLDEQLADPDLYRDKDRFHQVHQKRQAMVAELQPLESEWARRVDAS